MNKMIELKGIFEQNGFEINRFPEVYYDDYEIYSEKFEKNQNTILVGFENLIDEYEDNDLRNLEIDNEKIIDLLGVYTDFSIIDEKIDTKQGKIILFRDRIKAVADKLKITQKELKFVVLMHELGHWLSHWPKHQSENWAKGYSAKHKKTHESYAQLIAYWAVDGNPKLEDILEQLTPENRTDPYALYKNLTGYSKSSILKKLVEIRKHAFLTDDLMYAFLSCDVEFMYEIFIKSIEIGENNSIFLLNKIKKPNECFVDTVFDLLVNINKERKTTSCDDFPICLLGEYKFKEKFRNEFSQIFIDCRGAILGCEFNL